MTPTFNSSFHIDGVLRLSDENKWDMFNLLNMPLMANAVDVIDVCAHPENLDVAYGVAYGAAAFQITGDSVTAKSRFRQTRKAPCRKRRCTTPF